MYTITASRLGETKHDISGLRTPEQLSRAYPLSDRGRRNVALSRQTIRKILRGNDHRWCVVVGPCSIHEFGSALEYARRLKALADRVADTFFLVMRAYVEKPRTATGWKGLVNDPGLDGSLRMDKGLAIARGLLVELAELGLPAATEAVDPLVQCYLGDLVSWTAIGARTVESQTHRELASGLHSPVGFKNGTSGDLRVAVNAMRSSAESHRLLSIDAFGQASIVRTEGNPDTHIVLRGGKEPNCDRASVERCGNLLAESGLEPRIMIDCSHGNSQGRHENQLLVMSDVVEQIVEGNRSIRGVMLESNLYEGNQPLANPPALRYGVSITDKCLDWESTERGLLEARRRLHHRIRGGARVQPQPSPPWPDTLISRLRLLALLQTLNAGILSSPTATACLESWCRDHNLAEDPKIIAERIDGVSKQPTPERLRRLQVNSEDEVKFRRVRLRCGTRVLSEADNWYVPARLTGGINRLLETTDTPFGRAVESLDPYRKTFSARLLWSPLPPGWENEPLGQLAPEGALIPVPDSVLEHRAVLYTRDHAPLSLVEEIYKRPVLAFPSEGDAA